MSGFDDGEEAGADWRGLAGSVGAQELNRAASIAARGRQLLRQAREG